MANRNELFNERERLTTILKEISEEYEKGILTLKNRLVPKMNKLTEKISWIRSKLYELGVPLEDC